MPAATFSDMPQEILDEIVGHSVYSWADMANWALVCHSLRSRAQSHLYKGIKIVTKERIVQLMNLIQNNPLIPKYLNTIHVSARHFIPVHGIDSILASLFLLLKQLAPDSSITLIIAPISDTSVPHPLPAGRIPRELVLYSLSVITGLQLDDATGFPAEALFNFRRLADLVFNNTTIFPYYSNMFTPHRLSSIPTFFFRAITFLAFYNTRGLPGILISNCQALTHLTLENTTFSSNEEFAISSRPQITHLFLSRFDLETIKMLIDKVVDIRNLEELWDETEWDLYKNIKSEAYQSLKQCYKHLLLECSHSLLSLQIYCRT